MIYSQTTGKGKQRIVFVHGNSQSHETWDDVITDPALNSRYSLTTLDLPGHGRSFRSKAPSADYSLGGLARHLAAFLNAWEAGGYLLVATSLGSNVVAEAMPFLLDCMGIFLLCPCIGGGPYTPANIMQPNPNLAACFLPYPTEEQLDAVLNDLTFESREEWKTKSRQWFLDTDPAFREAIGVSIANQEWSDEIKNLENAGIPVAIASGAADKLIRPTYLADASLTKWRNEIIVLPEAGHCLQLEKTPLVANLIGEFAEDCFK